MEKLVATREEALVKGYLENKVVFLRPSPRSGKMIKDPAHVGWFMHEGATMKFVLPKNKRGEIINVFKSKEEQEYFESELGVDLNPLKKKDNFWHTFSVTFQKSPITMYEGAKFNLADSTDNLRARVLERCGNVAPNWDKRFALPAYKFALVAEDYEESKASEKALRQQEIWKFFGSIANNTTKMREFVGVYLANNKKIKSVPSDTTKEWLMKELSDIISQTCYRRQPAGRWHGQWHGLRQNPGFPAWGFQSFPHRSVWSCR